MRSNAFMVGGLVSAVLAPDGQSPARRRLVRSLLGLALLGALGFALFQASIVHTDDGCAVELHCFACRWQIVAQAVLSPPTTAVAALAPIGSLPLPVTPLGVEPIERETPSRGPPLSPQA